MLGDGGGIKQLAVQRGVLVMVTMMVTVHGTVYCPQGKRPRRAVQTQNQPHWGTQKKEGIFEGEIQDLGGKEKMVEG